jgi:ethanolamine utilization protein EutN
MQIGKVVGNIVSVSKIEELKDVKLFVVQFLDSQLMLAHDYSVSIDTIGVGIGDIVLITEGSGSRFTEISEPIHTDSSIVARIDSLVD